MKIIKTRKYKILKFKNMQLYVRICVKNHN